MNSVEITVVFHARARHIAAPVLSPDSTVYSSRISPTSSPPLFLLCLDNERDAIRASVCVRRNHLESIESSACRPGFTRESEASAQTFSQRPCPFFPAGPFLQSAEQVSRTLIGRVSVPRKAHARAHKCARALERKVSGNSLIRQFGRVPA